MKPYNLREYVPEYLLWRLVGANRDPCLVPAGELISSLLEQTRVVLGQDTPPKMLLLIGFTVTGKESLLAMIAGHARLRLLLGSRAMERIPLLPLANLHYPDLDVLDLDSQPRAGNVLTNRGRRRTEPQRPPGERWLVVPRHRKYWSTQYWEWLARSLTWFIHAWSWWSMRPLRAWLRRKPFMLSISSRMNCTSRLSPPSSCTWSERTSVSRLTSDFTAEWVELRPKPSISGISLTQLAHQTHTTATTGQLSRNDELNLNRCKCNWRGGKRARGSSLYINGESRGFKVC
uniref:Uncharacterized protein n=1 Tax=Oryza rufipogon TaxID=4529 RepID=A0A0E0RBM5_ORYRU